MSGSGENSFFFSGASDNETWLRREISGLCNEVIANSAYPDIEGKLLREIARDSARIDFVDLINPRIKTIIIKTRTMNLHYKPIGLLTTGLLVRDEVAEETVLIRGTAYCLSLDTFTDMYAYSMFNKHFLGENYPATVVDGSSLSVPFVAAKGQIGEHGYLVVSDAYGKEQVEEMLYANDLDAREFGLQHGPDGGLTGEYFMHNEAQTVKDTILDVDFELSTRPTS